MEPSFLSREPANDNAYPKPERDNEHVSSALLTLPPINQQVIRLHLYEQLSPVQIAIKLGLTESEIETLIQESKDQIRLALTKKET
jgi:DNA-directed RNA polymerase specialized sigma24 family protein